jgi:predicted lipid-binding transport protein (Tim44 family)
VNYSQKRQTLATGNPLANALVVLVGIVLIGLSLVLGIVAFIAIGSVVLVMASIIGIRVWWMQRRFRRQAGGQSGPTAPPSSADGDLIEGEYRVISRDTEDQ